MKKYSHARRPENTKVSVSMSKELLDQIDERAHQENRSRSNMISIMIKEEIQRGESD